MFTDDEVVLIITRDERKTLRAYDAEGNLWHLIDEDPGATQSRFDAGRASRLVNTALQRREQHIPPLERAVAGY
jgi:hypothetical protein